MPRRKPTKWPENARIALSFFVSWESWPDDLGTSVDNQITALFDGYELVEPGLVYLPQWRPEPDGPGVERPERFPGLAGVGRKP